MSLDAPSPSVFSLIFADVVESGLTFIMYFMALAPAVLGLGRLWDRSPLLLLVFVFLMWRVTAFLFILSAVALKWIVAGRIASGRYFLNGKKVIRWFLADRIVKTVRRSLFYPTINDSILLRTLYLRGMGGKAPLSLILGQGVILPEPWALQAGKDVVISDSATVAGHKVQGNVVSLDNVVIGDGVLIRARAMIFPGVRLGAGAVVGANSVVPRGTVVPPGRVWTGNPGRLEAKGS